MSKTKEEYITDIRENWRVFKDIPENIKIDNPEICLIAIEEFRKQGNYHILREIEELRQQGHDVGENAAFYRYALRDNTEFYSYIPQEALEAVKADDYINMIKEGTMVLVDIPSKNLLEHPEICAAAVEAAGENSENVIGTIHRIGEDVYKAYKTYEAETKEIGALIDTEMEQGREESVSETSSELAK